MKNESKGVNDCPEVGAGARPNQSFSSFPLSFFAVPDVWDFGSKLWRNPATLQWKRGVLITDYPGVPSLVLQMIFNMNHHCRGFPKIDGEELPALMNSRKTNDDPVAKDRKRAHRCGITTLDLRGGRGWTTGRMTF